MRRVEVEAEKPILSLASSLLRLASPRLIRFSPVNRCTHSQSEEARAIDRTGGKIELPFFPSSVSIMEQRRRV